MTGAMASASWFSVNAGTIGGSINRKGRGHLPKTSRMSKSTVSNCEKHADDARKSKDEIQKKTPNSNPCPADALTGCWNRTARSCHADGTYSIQYVWKARADDHVSWWDIDHFKSVNDNYGHHTGDEVLREVSSYCVSCSKRNLSFCPVYGGEEFCVMCRARIFDQRARGAEDSSGDS